MKMKYYSYFFALSFIFLAQFSFSQDEPVVSEEEEELDYTFTGTRVINGHSVEMLPKKTWEFRIEHKFGDIAGTNGGVQTMFGFDNVTDMRIALEYGVTEKFMVGFGRCKGTGSPYRSLLDGFAKYNVLKQKKGVSPITMTVVGTGGFTYMTASSDQSLVSHFPKVSHRFSYVTQINIARRFNDKLSLSVMPTFVHRNYVAANDYNELFALGGAIRYRISSRFAILGEYYHAFSSDNMRQGSTNSMAIALEWFTFGHNFTINITNSSGIGELQFIPYTTEKLSLGQFRLGFCVGRKFTKE
jgi:hypothetical protein